MSETRQSGESGNANTHNTQAEDSGSSTANPSLHSSLLDILACPVTKTPLVFDEQQQELISYAGKLAFPVVNGIPMLLKEEARDISDELPHMEG